MNAYNNYKIESLENNKQIICTKCELKGHTVETCYIDLNRRKVWKTQTVYITNSYIKCTKCDLSRHSAERCYINLRRQKALNTKI